MSHLNCSCTDLEHSQNCSDYDWKKWFNENIRLDGIIGPYYEFNDIREGIFSLDTNQYSLPAGWIQEQTKFNIIGESDSCFITHIINSEFSFWKGSKKCTLTFRHPVGIHKSRLVQWINTLF